MIKCAHCKGQHATVADVRTCSGVQQPQARPTATLTLNPTLVPEGRYCIAMDDTLKFYQIDKPTEGRWAGYTFVKVQASDETYPVRGRSATAVLETISRDVQGAMLRYGQKIGKCGHCGRTLTNEESRERGIGPVCAGNLGW